MDPVNQTELILPFQETEILIRREIIDINSRDPNESASVIWEPLEYSLDKHHGNEFYRKMSVKINHLVDFMTYDYRRKEAESQLNNFNSEHEAAAEVFKKIKKKGKTSKISLEDKKRVIKYHEDFPTTSFKEIAQLFGISQVAVAKYINKKDNTEDLRDKKEVRKQHFLQRKFNNNKKFVKKSQAFQSEKELNY